MEQQGSPRLPGLAALIVVGVVLGVAYARTLAPGVTWANDGADSGDLVTAAATLGVAHPTGYPTYLLLARLFMLIPLGDPALRATILSAVAGALAALGVCAIVRTLLAEPAAGEARGESPNPQTPHPELGARSPEPGAAGRAGSSVGGWPAAAGALAALALGLSPVFWSQAVVAEVYSLNALFVALLLLFALQAMRQPGTARGWGGRRRALVAGLALGNHVTIVPAVGAWLVATTLAAPRPARAEASTKNPRIMTIFANHARQFAFDVQAATPDTGAGKELTLSAIFTLADRLLWVGMGLLVYLYLPLRAAAHPPVNWGDPHDWAGFWWVVSGRLYRELAFGLSAPDLGSRSSAWASFLVEQFGWPGLALGFLGLLYGPRASRRFVWLTASVAAIVSVFAIAYTTADSYAYLIPVFLVFAIWIGMGAGVALGAIARRRPVVAVCAAAALLAALGWRTLAIAPQVDASQDRRAIAFAEAVLAAAPPNAVVVTANDLDSFPLWYAHYALGRRLDIAVVVEPLLDFDWYRRNVRAIYPSLQVPDAGAPTWPVALALANRNVKQVCWTALEREPALECGYQYARGCVTLGVGAYEQLRAQLYPVVSNLPSRACAALPSGGSRPA